jgi:hypothetical protein
VRLLCNEVAHAPTSLDEVFESCPEDCLVLQRLENSLALGLVVRMSDASLAASDRMNPEPVGIGLRGKLHPQNRRGGSAPADWGASPGLSGAWPAPGSVFRERSRAQPMQR